VIFRPDTQPTTASPTAAPSQREATLATTGRGYRDINEALAALPEIVGSIEAKTGWRFDRSKVEFTVVSAKEMERRCLDDLTRRTGIPTITPEVPRGREVGAMLLSAHHRSAIAMYLPSDRVVVINEERLSEVSKDSMKSALHHELTRAAQHQRFPEYVAGVDGLARQQILLEKHGGDLPHDTRVREAAVLTDQVQARLALCECQALELRKRYELEFDLHPEVKQGPIEVALEMGSLRIAGGADKVQRYIMGQEIFSKVYDHGTYQVDSLFQHPKWADTLFGSSLPGKASRRS
jgi:hypothetical protein